MAISASDIKTQHLAVTFLCDSSFQIEPKITDAEKHVTIYDLSSSDEH